jgi:hypothetical protein
VCVVAAVIVVVVVFVTWNGAFPVGVGVVFEFGAHVWVFGGALCARHTGDMNEIFSKRRVYDFCFLLFAVHLEKKTKNEKRKTYQG